MCFFSSFLEGVKWRKRYPFSSNKKRQRVHKNESTFPCQPEPFFLLFLGKHTYTYFLTLFTSDRSKTTNSREWKKTGTCKSVNKFFFYAHFDSREKKGCVLALFLTYFFLLSSLFQCLWPFHFIWLVKSRYFRNNKKITPFFPLPHLHVFKSILTDVVWETLG